MTDPMDRAPAETRQGAAGAHQDGPAGMRPDALPAGPLARLQQLAAGWDTWAAEVGTVAGLISGAATPTDVWYLHGQAAGKTEAAEQLRAVLDALQAAPVERDTEREA